MCKLQFRSVKINITVEELGNLIPLHTTEDFREEWNAGLRNQLFQLAKESLDERLCSDSSGEVKNESELSETTFCNCFLLLQWNYMFCI